MKKKIWILSLLLLSLTMAGCQKQKATKPASSSSKTIITSKKYNTKELQSRYEKIVDAVVKPLDMASYSQPNDVIKKQVTTSRETVDNVRLELVSNTSLKDQTQALVKLAGEADTMLEAMVGQNQDDYNAKAKVFMSDTSDLAKKYFNGGVPESLSNYSKRMANRTSSDGEADKGGAKTEAKK